MCVFQHITERNYVKYRKMSVPSAGAEAEGKSDLKGGKGKDARANRERLCVTGPDHPHTDDKSGGAKRLDFERWPAAGFFHVAKSKNTNQVFIFSK